MKLFRKVKEINKLKWFRFLIGIVVFLFIWANYSVYVESKNYISSNLKVLPKTKVCLLLGTSRTLRKGKPNDYFFNRIDACVRLFESGKVKYILISGDNSTKLYNEPEDMKQELIAHGIPAKRIFLDYAGFDTYDSVIRANKVFGLNGFIVVSQKFHNQRAVYIARRFGIKAYGYNAADVKKMSGIKTKIRESFACVKAYFEVKMSVDPKFLGEKISIE